MTSRHALWIALGLGLAPLCFEATTGCDQVFQLERTPTVLMDNALRCACRCDGTGSPQIAVSASTDDAEQTGAIMDLTDGDLDLGQKIVGLRFDGVGIPKDATIQGAYVQFTANATLSAATNYTIAAEASTAAASFSAMNSDLSGRMVGPSIMWSPLGWTNGTAGPAQQTPPLTALLQALVAQPGWSSASPVLLRIQPTVAGTGQRAAKAFDGNPAQAPVLFVSYATSVAAALPVCASADAVRDAEGRITGTSLIAECGRVEETFEGLAQACNYPTPCDCEVVDVPDQDDSFESTVCEEPCAEVAVDAGCTNFDPNAFNDCLVSTASLNTCTQHLAATNASGDSPVCVASGSPLAFHMFGRRSLCELAGTATIDVGDHESNHPVTVGSLELLGGPCPGQSCSVHPYFDLQMDPVEFSVKWHSDPRFVNMSASGHGLATALLDDAGEASFPVDAIEGTGNGSRVRAVGPNEGRTLVATNAEPLDIGVDWLARTCHMEGNVAGSVDGETPDGVCDGDGTTACTMDSPDCDGPGGPCVFETEDTEEMRVDVVLDVGELVNQPPRANAGPNQTPECTSTAGAPFTLDGRGSSDPDQNLALASWRRGSRMGPELTEGLVVGQALGVGASETYFLRVIDALEQTDEDETTVMVKDSTPPVVSAQWTPRTPLGLYPRFLLVFSATDTCDAAPQVIGVVETPDLTGWKVTKRRSTVSPLKLDYDLLRRTLEIRAADPDAILAQLLANGGLPVNSGQPISVVPEKAYEMEFELEFERNGNLKLEAPAPSLEVTAKDVSGNAATTLVHP